MAIELPKYDKNVLRSKFQEAHALVDWYERKLQELTMAIRGCEIGVLAPSDLRNQFVQVLKSIQSHGHASSLVEEDRAAVEEYLGDAFRLRLCDAMKSCEESWARLHRGSRHKLSSIDERSQILQVAATTWKVFELGLDPIRELRNTYVQALKCSASRNQSKRKPGRPKDKSKPLRDHKIYTEFRSMSGTKAQKIDAMAKQYKLGCDSIRKIVREQERNSLGK